MPEMPFAKNHDVVEAFPPDRADETFAISILPGGPRGCWSVSNAHRPQSTFEDLAIGTVPVTDDVAWRAVPTDGFGELPGDPLCRRMGCRRQVKDLAPVVVHHHKSV